MKEKYMLCNGRFLKFVNESDYIKEQYNTMNRRNELLHDQDWVFDRGKDQCSPWGGMAPPNFILHQVKYRYLVCFSRDSWNLIMPTEAYFPNKSH